jgi:hypothetical protein
LRWYLRVAGLLMVLLSLVAGTAFGNPLLAVATEVPIFVVGLGAFLDSFGKRMSWLFGAVLALEWCGIAFGFLFVFTGAKGPPVFVPILSVLLALLGLVIVPLAIVCGSSHSLLERPDWWGRSTHAL